MKFLKITSVSKTSIEDLFTLGVSTSRGNESKIGQFGSGTLLGTLAWMRSNEKKAPIFLVNGRIVEFTVKTLTKGDGQPFDQILMNNVPTSVCLEYGIKDWPNPELGLREWISNAIDAGQPFEKILSVVDEISAEPNEVAVFVPYNRTAADYHKNIDKYFLHGTPHFRERDSAIIPKAEPSPCRIYRRNVYVRTLEKDISLFDYNLWSVDINECRTGSSDQMSARAFNHVHFFANDEQTEMMANAILEKKDYLETDSSNVPYYNTFLIVDWFKKKVGTIGLSSDSFPVANTIALNPEWYKKLTSAIPELDGISHITEAQMRQCEIVEPPEELIKFYNLCWETFSRIEYPRDISNKMKKVCPKLITCRRTRDSISFFDGLYSKRVIPEITIVTESPSYSTDGGYKQQAMSRMKTIVVHEFCHHFSGGADDHTSEFSDVAHVMLQELLTVMA